MPRRKFSSMCNWRWDSSSAEISCCCGLPRKDPRARKIQVRNVRIMCAPFFAHKLFVAKGHYRIDAGCAACWDEAAQQSDEADAQQSGYERKYVTGRYAKEHGAHQASAGDCQRDA